MRYLGLEFWLPLPIIGLVFWVASGFVTDRILTNPHLTDKYLQTENQTAKRQKRIILAIQVEIFRNAGISRIKVQTDNSALKQLLFEFPTTDISQIETAISQELGLPLADVRQLVTYQEENKD